MIKFGILEYSQGAIKTFFVDGQDIRDNIFQDFTEGGHGYVYDFIPENEVWLDFDITAPEVKPVLLHELHERRLMQGGLSYDAAHDQANIFEEQVREDPDLGDAMVAEELKIAKSIIPYEVRSKAMASDIIRKSVPLVIRKSEGGQEEILISTANYDRGNDRVFPHGVDMTNYLKNPVIMWIHDYAGHTAAAGIPVAKNSYIKVTDEGIVAGPPIFLEGDPFAERVANAWKRKFINSASIGFRPIESEPNEKGGTDYKSCEMLEWSFAPIPMNAEAMRIAKSEGFGELGECKDNKPSEISQGEIKDEIDYLISIVKGRPLNEDNLALLKALDDEIRRITGSDMPEKIEPIDVAEAIIAVLNKTKEHISK